LKKKTDHELRKLEYLAICYHSREESIADTSGGYSYPDYALDPLTYYRIIYVDDNDLWVDSARFQGVDTSKSDADNNADAMKYTTKLCESNEWEVWLLVKNGKLIGESK